MMKPSPLGGFEFEHHVAELAADFVVLDLARNADASQRGHQHQVAAGNADIGRERRAFGADALFDDLDQHFVTAAKDLLDRRLDARPGTGPDTPAAAIARFVFVLFTVFAILIGVAMPRAVRSDGLDWLGRVVTALAEILRFDVTDVQETVASYAEIDEGSLNAGFEIDDPAFVDIPYVIILAGAFNVELFENSVLDDRNPALFGLRYVDQHLLLHDPAFLSG